MNIAHITDGLRNWHKRSDWHIAYAIKRNVVMKSRRYKHQILCLCVWVRVSVMIHLWAIKNLTYLLTYTHIYVNMHREPPRLFHVNMHAYTKAHTQRKQGKCLSDNSITHHVDFSKDFFRKHKLSGVYVTFPCWRLSLLLILKKNKTIQISQCHCKSCVNES